MDFVAGLLQDLIGEGYFNIFSMGIDCFEYTTTVVLNSVSGAVSEKATVLEVAIFVCGVGLSIGRYVRWINTV